MNEARFSLDDLIRVGHATPPHRQPRFGEQACLNSGGPIGLVVDISGDDVTIAWNAAGRITEKTLPAACLSRVEGAAQ